MIYKASIFFEIMRYFYEKPMNYTPLYGLPYICNHPLYKECSLYLIKDKGLAVVQQRYDPDTKVSWWGAVDPWLANDIYLNCRFMSYFVEKAEKAKDGLYPTVTVRQIMWGLKMKPLKKEYWESQLLQPL